MIAEGVRHKRRGEMARPDKQIGRVDSENGRVEELEKGHRKDNPERRTVAKTFLDVMQMGKTEEKRRYQHGHVRPKRLQQQRQHAGTEGKLLGKGSDQMVPEPHQILYRIDPVHRLGVDSPQPVR